MGRQNWISWCAEKCSVLPCGTESNDHRAVCGGPVPWEVLMHGKTWWGTRKAVCDNLLTSYALTWHLAGRSHHQLWALLLSSLARGGHPSVQTLCHGPVSTVIESARIWEMFCHQLPCKIHPTSYTVCEVQAGALSGVLFLLLWVWVSAPTLPGAVRWMKSFCACGETVGGKFMARFRVS